MKRHFLPFIAVFLLSACTSVEDFGAYWDKGFVDPALEGTWQKIGMPELRGKQGTPGGRTQNGMIERYEIKGGLLLEYRIQNGAAVDFLEAKHPTAKNIVRNRGEGRYVVINTFDDEVFQILSEISDNAKYWELSCRYKKAS